MLSYTRFALLAGMLFSSPLVQAQTLTVTEFFLVGNGTDQFDGAVSGDNVVFTDVRNGNQDIFHVDVTSPLALPIVQGAGEQKDASIDGDLVVFTDDALGDDNIGLHNLSTGTTSILNGNGAGDVTPTISGTDVLFVSTRGAGGIPNIWQANALSPLPLPLTNTLSSAGSPDVSGPVRAWTEVLGGGLNVFVQVNGGTPFAVSNEVAIERTPCVDDNLVAYLRNGEIFVYDITTGLTTEVIAHPGFDKQRVHLNGTDVIFADASTGNFDIYVHQLPTGQTFALTEDSVDQTLTDVDGNRIVFHDDRFGDFDVWALDYHINRPAVIDAGPDATFVSTQPIALEGNIVDPDDDPITSAAWTFTRVPEGSITTESSLTDASDPNATFFPDINGIYELRLDGGDGIDPSEPDFVTLFVPEPDTAPMLLAGTLLLAAAAHHRRKPRLLN